MLELPLAFLVGLPFVAARTVADIRVSGYSIEVDYTLVSGYPTPHFSAQVRDVFSIRVPLHDGS